MGGLFSRSARYNLWENMVNPVCIPLNAIGKRDTTSRTFERPAVDAALEFDNRLLKVGQKSRRWSSRGPPLTQDATSSRLSFADRVWRDWLRRLRHPAAISLTFGAIVITVLVGPFNTYDSDPLASRLAFWSAIVIVATLYSNLVAATAENALPNYPFWRRAIVGGTAFSLPYFAFVWWLVTTLYPKAAVPHPAVILILIAAITIAVYGVIWGFTRTLAAELAAQAPPPPRTASANVTPPLDRSICAPGTNPLLARLGPKAGHRLIRMAMSDHYIEIHTETGKHLLHMRFADAVAALDPETGGQVHRSHWVTWDEIADVERDSQKRAFRLKDGSRVPIARSRVKDLRDRGLL